MEAIIYSRVSSLSQRLWTTLTKSQTVRPRKRMDSQKNISGKISEPLNPDPEMNSKCCWNIWQNFCTGHYDLRDSRNWETRVDVLTLWNYYMRRHWTLIRIQHTYHGDGRRILLLKCAPDFWYGAEMENSQRKIRPYWGGPACKIIRVQSRRVGKEFSFGIIKQYQNVSDLLIKQVNLWGDAE